MDVSNEEQTGEIFISEQRLIALENVIDSITGIKNEKIDYYTLMKSVIQKYDQEKSNFHDNFGSKETNSSHEYNKIELVEAIQDIIKEFHCQYCDFKTNIKLSLKDHINGKHLNIENHVRNVHKEGKDLICENTDYIIVEEEDLRNHKFNHKDEKVSQTLYTDEEEITTCSTIDEVDIPDVEEKETKIKTSLLHNISNKNDENNTKKEKDKCNLCGYLASTKIELKKHERKHIGYRKNKKCFICLQCTFITYYKLSLQRHVDAIHYKKRDFHCQYCDYETSSKQVLSFHINAKHFKMRNYECDFCNYKSAFPSNLTEHRNSKHSKGIYLKCTYCEYLTVEKKDLKNHFRKNHMDGKGSETLQTEENIEKQKDISNCSNSTINEVRNEDDEVDVPDVEENETSQHHNISNKTDKKNRKKHIKRHGLKKENPDKEKCVLCDYVASTIIDLEEHEKKHIRFIKNIKYFVCLQCDFMARFKGWLKRHIDVIQHEKKNFLCQYCDYETFSKKTLSKHIDARHLDIKKHECRFCDFKSAFESSLIRHIKNLHKKGENFECNYCKYCTVEEDDLINHLKNNHKVENAEDKEEMICNVKNGNYKADVPNVEENENFSKQEIETSQHHNTSSNNDKNNMQIHLKRPSLKREKNKCLLCDYIASTKTDLKKHEEKHTCFMKNKKYFKCPQCEYITQYKASLKTHFDSVHHKNRYFHCEFCNYEAHTKVLLKTHINGKHLKIKKYECDFCDYKSAFQSNLIAHRNSKHSKGMYLKCKYCQYLTVEEDDLMNHFKTNHKEENVEDKEEKSICDVKNGNYKVDVPNVEENENFSKQEIETSQHHYTSNNNDKNNMKIHLKRPRLKKEKNKCLLCDYIASTKTDLKKHGEKHTCFMKNKKYFICPQCEYITQYKANLKTHFDSVHHKNRYFHCQFCNYEAHTKALLKIHINGKHLKIKKYECDFCDYKSAFQSNLIKHRNSKHSKGIYLKCKYCEYLTVEKEDLKNHFRKNHMDGKGSETEENIEKQKDISNSSNSTINEVRNEDDEVKKVDSKDSFYLNVKFDDSSVPDVEENETSQHHNISNKNDKKNVKRHCLKKENNKCDLCGYHATTKIHLKKHEKKHTRSKKK